MAHPHFSPGCRAVSMEYGSGESDRAIERCVFRGSGLSAKRHRLCETQAAWQYGGPVLRKPAEDNGEFIHFPALAEPKALANRVGFPYASHYAFLSPSLKKFRSPRFHYGDVFSNAREKRRQRRSCAHATKMSLATTIRTISIPYSSDSFIRPRPIETFRAPALRAYLSSFPVFSWFVFLLFYFRAHFSHRRIPGVCFMKGRVYSCSSENFARLSVRSARYSACS